MAPIRPPFRRAPAALRTFIVGCVVAALVLPFLLRHLGQTSTKNPLAATLVALLVVSVLNVEIGRLLEGGISTSRPGPQGPVGLGLRGGAAAADAVHPAGGRGELCARPVARHAGAAVEVGGSAAFVVLAGVAAAVVVRALHGPNPNLMDDDGG